MFESPQKMCGIGIIFIDIFHMIRPFSNFVGRAGCVTFSSSHPPWESDQRCDTLWLCFQTLASAVVQVFLADPPGCNRWNKRCCGVATFIKDNHKRSYFIRVYNLKVLSKIQTIAVVLGSNLYSGILKGFSVTWQKYFKLHLLLNVAIILRMVNANTRLDCKVMSVNQKPNSSHSSISCTWIMSLMPSFILGTDDDLGAGTLQSIQVQNSPSILPHLRYRCKGLQ